MSDIWIVNASPTIVLAKIGQLALLEALTQEVLLPEIVAQEILSGAKDDPARQALEAGWGKRIAVSVTPVASALRLDAGETAVIAAALERGRCTVVLDDGKARKAARSLGLTVIGTLGILLKAKQQGYIDALNPLLNSLRAAGMFLDETLMQSVLKAAGETE